MGRYWIILLIYFMAVAVTVFTAKWYSKKEKVDKGFVLCYWKLSYRRKFIRTLFLLPMGIIVLIPFYFTFRCWPLTWGFCLLYFGALGIQAVYTYRKWKHKEDPK